MDFGSRILVSGGYRFFWGDDVVFTAFNSIVSGGPQFKSTGFRILGLGFRLLKGCFEIEDDIAEYYRAC